jgi:hypothetical protein
MFRREAKGIYLSVGALRKYKYNWIATGVFQLLQ